MSVTESQVLRLSRDRKIFPYVAQARSGKSFRALPERLRPPGGKGCQVPGATKVCETVCYAGRLELAYPSVHRMLEHNQRTLQGCGDDVPAMV